MDRTVTPTESASYAVLCAVSEREGVDVLDLPPLHDSVDCDALNTLTVTGECSVSFRYSNCSVTVQNTDHLTVVTQLLKNPDVRNGRQIICESDEEDMRGA